MQNHKIYKAGLIHQIFQSSRMCTVGISKFNITLPANRHLMKLVFALALTGNVKYICEQLYCFTLIICVNCELKWSCEYL